jgi:hypothetical protein
LNAFLFVPKPKCLSSTELPMLKGASQGTMNRNFKAGYIKIPAIRFNQFIRG